jgi:hypothetical protein
VLLGYKCKHFTKQISCFIFAVECAEGSDLIIVDGSTTTGNFEFSVLEGINDSPKSDEIENNAASGNPNAVTVLFENTNPQNNKAVYMYFDGHIDSKDDTDVQLQITFITDYGTFTTNVSHL